MSVRTDERGVSEIVGALMLVVVVSSAVFGFGLFLSQQAKLTQEQKAAELQRQLEQLEIGSVLPLADAFDGSCTPIGGIDDSWHSLAFRVTSRHLRDSTLTAFRVNDLVVRHLAVVAPPRAILDAVTNTGVGTSDLVDSPGGHFVADDIGRYIQVGTTLPTYTTILEVIDATQVRVSVPAAAVASGATLGDRTFDLGLGPGDAAFRELVVPARQSITIRLENLAMDATGPTTTCSPGSTPPYSLHGGAPIGGSPGPIKVGDAIEAEVNTELANSVERAFIPPSAVILLEQGGATNGFILDASRSNTATDLASLVSYQWTVELDSNDPGTGAPSCAGAAPVVCTYKGRTVLGSDILNGDEAAAPSYTYVIQLTVKDSFGMVGTATYTLTL